MKIATCQVSPVMAMKVIARMDFIVFWCRTGKWHKPCPRLATKRVPGKACSKKKNRHPYLVYSENSKAYQEPLKAHISIQLSLRSWDAKLWAYFWRHAGPESKRPSFSAKLVNAHQRVKSHQTVPNASRNHFPVSHERWVTEILTWCMFFMSVQEI